MDQTSESPLPERQVAIARSEKSPRALLARDAIVFQVKMLVCGIIGAVLAPLALIAAAFGLIVRGGSPGRYFYQALRLGRSVEHWIDLYRDADGDTRRAAPGEGLDTYVAHIEDAIERNARTRETSRAS